MKCDKFKYYGYLFQFLFILSQKIFSTVITSLLPFLSSKWQVLWLKAWGQYDFKLYAKHAFIEKASLQWMTTYWLQALRQSACKHCKRPMSIHLDGKLYKNMRNFFQALYATCSQFVLKWFLGFMLSLIQCELLMLEFF